MKDLALRDYQLASVEALRQGIVAGHRHQLLCAPTGAGKSVMAVHLIQQARLKGSRTAFFVDRISLIDQISAMFDEYGIDHGVIQANHWRYKTYEPVQIISTGTLARRDLSKLPPFDLAVVDEAHIVIKAVQEFIAGNPQMKVTALTATPFTKGLGKLYSNIVNVTTTNKLIAEGWLAPFKVYAAKKIDMKGAKIKFDGEWEPTEIEKRSVEIIGDIVEEWKDKTTKHFGGPVKTIVFSATVAHGDELCRQFQSVGVNMQQVSYLDGNDAKRRSLIEEFRKPNSEIMGLVSCEALGRGFDVPDIKCLIAARPYRKSLSSWVQQFGRGMRPAPGKDFVLVIDHAGNFLRFQEDMAEFFENGVHDLSESDLDKKVRKEPEEKGDTNACKGCGYVMLPTDMICPSCGMARPKRRNQVEHAPGQMVEVGLRGANGKRLADWLQDKQHVQRQIWGLALHKKQGDRVAAEKFALAQYRNIYNEWPRFAFRNVEPESCSLEVQGKIKSNLIRYFKGRKAA